MQSRNEPQILAAAQQWPGNQQVAIDQLRPIAESGDAPAAALLAYLLGPQTARWQEGIVYARQAAEAGISAPAYVYSQNLLGQPDPNLRRLGLELLPIALDAGWPIEPFGLVLQAVNQSDASLAMRLLDLGTDPRPSEAQKRWEQLFADMSARQHEVVELAAGVRRQSEIAVADMQADRTSVANERQSVEALAEQVGVLANKTAGGAIAADYAARAEIVEKTARNYTRASIVLALLIAIGGVVATLVVNEGKVVDDAASKAAIAIPLVALNLYLGRLASQYRQEAVSLRHIELQFNTANPFLGSLDDERRKDVLAQLATKFFPGQPLPGASSSGDDKTDMSQVLSAALVERLTSAPTKSHADS